MILFVSNADTELLALRVAIESLPAGFPGVRAGHPDRLAEPPALDGVDAVVVRLLSGRQAWEGPFDALRAACVDAGVALYAFGGEAVPDAELTSLSTVAPGVLAELFPYLVQGGPDNIGQLLLAVAGWEHAPPATVAASGIHRETASAGGPLVGVVFYRSHLVAGNTGFVDDLCDALEARGARARAVWCYSLRGDGAPLDLLVGCDAVVTTVLAAGADDGDDGWTSPLAVLDVPVVQAVAATTARKSWESSSAGIPPIDVAMQVAIPEFDGRIVSVPFSFKEVVDDGDELGAGVSAYRTVPDRVARVAGVAVRLAALRTIPRDRMRVAVVLSAYPTKRSRIGNAVGLDTPASVIELLHDLRRRGYDVERIPVDGDALMAELADGLPYESSSMTAEQRGRAAGTMAAAEYDAVFAALPSALQSELVEAWGPPPGDTYVGDGELVFPGVVLGNVAVFVQPPRGFGDNPIAVYHSPVLPPTHHYVAFYRWLDEHWGADAVVHVGKHGTLEWLPGKGVGLSAACWPDAVLGDLPLLYPFVVNDPGEGTQAKRRAHAVIVDHLMPPMTRAEVYDDLARLESLLDTYYQVETLDPSKLPAIQREVWELLESASLHRDLGVDGMPEAGAFGDFVQHIDGYLCELKDAQIRGGLHVLGLAPEGDELVDTVLALTRLPQGRVPSLRRTVADDLGDDGVDVVEAECRRRVEAVRDDGWRYDGGDPTLRWVAGRLIPALARTAGELDAVAAGLAGRFVPAGPSGAPTRGMAHVLPTGRNFYSVDPKALPSPLAWEVGRRLASALIDRHVAEEGVAPQTVGLVIWGTAAMRTMGDDVAEALALLGVRPEWHPESGRVTGLSVIPLTELGRPRIDVTLRISGFFRDAFPNLVALLDEAVELAASCADESVDDNYVRRHGGDDPRIFGPKPGAYGSGILAAIETREWDTDEDLAAVYRAWGGWAYRRGAMGRADPAAMARRFGAIDVAVKNQDNREHDIFDSDDYLQDHGGMVVTARVLSGRDVKAWFGDTADPSRPRVRSLAEEAARVVRTRVVNPKWMSAMRNHGYKGAFEMAATVDYLFGYDATTHVVDDWMYERVTEAYVGDAEMRKFFERANPWALRSIAERLLEANERGMWRASDDALAILRSAVLEAEGWEEAR